MNPAFLHIATEATASGAVLPPKDGLCRALSAYA
jgi:hypothetical protein